MGLKSAAMLAASFCLAASSLLEAAPLSRTTRMVASDTVQSRAPTMRSGSGVMKQIWFAHGGTARVTWEYRVDGVSMALLFNGATHECEPTTNSTTFVAATCDINVPAGGTVSLALFSFDVNATGALRRVAVSYDLVEATRASIVVED